MPLPPLFNPSNDMALAANLRQYTPPRHIQQMEADLASLARQWDDGPWGWSLATRQHYLRMGIDPADLPSEAWLAGHRSLSSRQFAVAYYRQLVAQLEPEWGPDTLLPCRARYVEGSEADTLFASFGPTECAILKSPWSSSGRGNMVVRGMADESARRRILKTIREQGGIVVEPFYADKALDFAMEFHVGQGGTDFLGYSVFDADEMGHYRGNWVESQEQLLGRIALPQTLLDRLVQYHCSALSQLPYQGPVGIDMMRLADGRVHPCVEINFRRTMGWLALTLYNKGIRDDQLLAGHARQGFSASIRNGRLIIES